MSNPIATTTDIVSARTLDHLNADLIVAVERSALELRGMFRKIGDRVALVSPYSHEFAVKCVEVFQVDEKTGKTAMGIEWTITGPESSILSENVRHGRFLACKNVAQPRHGKIAENISDGLTTVVMDVLSEWYQSRKL